MEYKTQMHAAKMGIITPQMKHVAKKEHIGEQELCELIALGQVVIPANIRHTSLNPHGIGTKMRTKINVNLGISKDSPNFEAELCKVKTAIEMKAESIMDLSNYGQTQEMRRQVIELSPAIIGTVPIYDAFEYYDKDLKDFTADDFFSVVSRHAEDGVDFITVHAGLNLEAVNTVKRNMRLTNVVSRGGSLLFAWMEMNQAENPFFEQFDRLLDICQTYDVTLSLGDALRPGSINDASDAAQIKELITLGELTKRAWEKNVQVIVEGPGHMAINEIQANMQLQKRMCHGAPFYVLGPIVTDIAPGYDHITSAIGGAIAASSGADFLCYVTPAEHLRLPTLEDMKEGIIATKIAAHAADIAKGIPLAREWDNQMSAARADLDWAKMFDLALNSDKAKQYRKDSDVQSSDSCSMCGKMCSMRTMKMLFAGEEPSLK